MRGSRRLPSASKSGLPPAITPTSSQARALVRDLIVALQGSLLVRHAPSNVSDAFCASRLDGEGAPVFGLLPRGLDTRGIAERAGPAN